MRRKKATSLKKLFKMLAKRVAPPKKMLISEWADTYRQLSSEASAEPGRWSTARAPYQRRMMDCISDNSVKEVVFMTSSQIGKALAIDTPIPTPNGWTTMGQIEVGDKIYSEKGEECNVIYATEVMYDRECYKITFSDGFKIITDKNHKWTVNVCERGIMTLETGDMLNDYKKICSNGKIRNRYSIPVARPLDTKEKKLLIDPYTLGVWLGDGNSYSAQITMHKDDLEMAEYIRQQNHKVVVRQTEKAHVMNLMIDPLNRDNVCIRGHDMNVTGRTKRGHCAECARQHAMRYKHKDDSYLDPIVNKSTMYHKLVELKVIKNKHIPNQYLRASYFQRLELLQGLMDSDGYISKTGHCEITLKSKLLIDGVSELLHTLGIKHTLKTKIAICTNSKNKSKSKVYRISFMIYDNVPVFKLRRKLARMKKEGDKTRCNETYTRWIVNIEKVESVPVRCIQVDSPSHLYLAGKNMVPTHNTEILNNVVGYYIDYDPSPMLLVQPTVEMAEVHSTDRLAPMIRDTKVLTNKVSDVKSKDGSNKIRHKLFPGGHISLAGANSASTLAGRPVRLLLCDEVDRYPASAGTEGDPIMLAHKRTTTFWNKKHIYVSTPTIKGASRIEMEYNSSTMEEWSVYCPSCGELQPYEWARINFDSVTMTCMHCGALHSEHEWKAKEGKWVAKFPERTKIGFHLNELASPWKKWSEIISDFLYAKQSPELLKVWVNTSLGETWEEIGKGADEQALYERREDYNCEVPDDVLVLTAGVDTQDNRFELEVVGWGEGEESWGIQYKVIYGDLHQPDVWLELDKYLQREFSYENGRKIRISTVCIDTGGHFTQDVYRFAREREMQHIYAIKGKGGESVPFINKPNRKSREGVMLFTLGVDAGKETIISNLKLEVPGIGYCHFPREHQKGYGADFFKGLTSESLVIKMVNGRPVPRWTPKAGVRNEPLDCRNYALAALRILNPDFQTLKKERNGKKVVHKTIGRRVISKGVEL